MTPKIGADEQTSATSTLINERRRAARGNIPSPLLDDHPDSRDSPLDETLARDRMRRFREALDCPTPNAARVTVARALRRLAQRMADQDAPP